MTTIPAELLAQPGVAAALSLARIPGAYEAFRHQVVAAGACRHPVRLQGRVTRTATGEVVFDTADLPDGVLLKACGTRRETLCPPCARLYRSDAFALVVAGLRAVLLTLTAPSFGPVHRRLADGTCHLGGWRCGHGRALLCSARHDEDDELLGQALAPCCYDYAGAVLWNASVSELWRRTTIYALRALGTDTGLGVRTAAATWRLSYVKVVEFQRRGSVHLHALVRLDERDGAAGAPLFDASRLAAALVQAAKKVSAPGPSGIRHRWGAQLDVALVADEDDRRRRAAAYCAKYATKGVAENGALDRRLTGGVPAHLELPDHLRRLVETAWALGPRGDLQDLRLRAWAHTCGFRGHVLTKSRGYSTTFTALRAERQA